jgi:ferritin heavy chain
MAFIFCNLLVISLVLSVTSVSHCPDKKCNYIDNDIPRGHVQHSVNVPWRLENRAQFTLTEEAANMLNVQINLEFQAFYTYTSMAYYFNRDDVALTGFHEFFKKAAAEEISHAQEMMAYANSRGAKLMLGSIAPSCVGHGLLGDIPTDTSKNYADSCEGIHIKAKRTESQSGPPTLSYCDWQDPLVAVTMARELEIKVYKNLVDLHSAVQQDISLADFIEKFIEEGVHSVKALSDLVSQLKRVEPCIGYHLIDKELVKTK